MTRHRSLLCLCWIALLVVAPVAVASERNAMVHLDKATTLAPGNATTTTTNTATSPTTSSPECPLLLTRLQYEMCLRDVFPFLPSDAFVLTANNSAVLCRTGVCAAALGDFAASVRETNCTLVRRKANVSVDAHEIQQLANACGVGPTSRTVPPMTTAPPPVLTPAPTTTSKPPTKTEQQASDSDRTLTYVGIAGGVAALLVCGLVGLANGHRSKGTEGDAVYSSLNCCC